MRYPEDKIKEAILHPGIEIRDRAVSYFAKSLSTDTSLMPLVIKAVETYGRQNDAYRLIGASRDLANRIARAVTAHATPVGSGTVARTKRIPIERRAEAALIAWMRHQPTGYDGMKVPRIKGKRREVRRMLARRSHELLERYRRGEHVGEDCPLKRALADGRVEDQ
jgi:hypothetical protein